MSEDFPITIFHNPGCGTSRNTLAMIESAGYAPTVVEYLQTGWKRPQRDGLVAAMGAKPRDLLRVKGTPAEETPNLAEQAKDWRFHAALVQSVSRARCALVGVEVDGLARDLVWEDNDGVVTGRLARRRLRTWGGSVCHLCPPSSTR